jgi:hypothetical protein
LDSKTLGRFLPYLGSRSYSIYLVHVLVGSNLIRLLLRLNWAPNTLLVLLGYFALALLTSFLAAEILYRLVERPTHRLGRRIAWESPTAAPTVRAKDRAKVLPGATQFAPSPAEGLFATHVKRRWPAFAAALRVESGWLIPTFVFAAIWFLELYVVQELTLSPGYTVGKRFDFYAPKIRFLMDICFIGAVMSLLSRGGLAIVAIGGSLLNLVLLTYYNYFYRPLSLLHVLQNFKEGMEISVFAWDLLDGAMILSLSAVLVLKLLALRAIPAASRWRSPAWLGIFGAFAIGYVVLFAIGDYVDPLEKIAYKRTLGRLGIIRGYLGPWIGEFYYLNDERLIERALQRRDFKSDQLTPVEIPLQIEPRLVIIQAESLDQNVIGYSANGKVVTPFLNRLRDSAMYFRVKVFHFQGSCDSDFTMLEGVAATPAVNAYNMPSYPFEHSLPDILQQHGFQAVALHGYHSAFYNRGAAFQKMGFKRALFQEKLESEFGLPLTPFGIRDQDVLRLSSHILRESHEPTCHFIISLTSHTPYNYVTPLPDYPYPRPASKAEWYFDSMRYLDDCLQEYVKSLPEHTTLVIYGDHCTEVASADFTSDRGDNAEYVPCFIYDTDRDLAAEQLTRHEPISVDGTLNLLDISTYLRNRITAVDAVTRRDGQPVEVDSKTPVSPSGEPLPANPQSKLSVPLGSLPDADPIARRHESTFPIRAPDNP